MDEMDEMDMDEMDRGAFRPVRIRVDAGVGFAHGPTARGPAGSRRSQRVLPRVAGSRACHGARSRHCPIRESQAVALTAVLPRRFCRRLDLACARRSLEKEDSM
jgi:hypothetical protein